MAIKPIVAVAVEAGRVDVLDDERAHEVHATVADEEGCRIALRTKEALAAYKAGRRISRRIRAMYPEGVPAEVVEAVAGKLGASLPQCRNLTADARSRGARSAALAHRVHADEAYLGLGPAMVEMRISGLTLQQIADALNAGGHRTRRGAAWNKVQVQRVVARIRAAETTAKNDLPPTRQP